MISNSHYILDLLRYLTNTSILPREFKVTCLDEFSSLRSHYKQGFSDMVQAALKVVRKDVSY